MLKLTFYRLATALAPKLPSSLLYALAWLGGAIAYWVAPGPRRAVTENMRRVLGPNAGASEVRNAVRGVFRTTAYNYLDLFLIPATNPDELSKRVEILHPERFYEAYDKGKGVIIATAHLGGFDQLVQIARHYNLEVTILVEALEPPELFTLIKDLRGSHGLHLVTVDTGGLRTVLRTLRSGGVVVITVDRDIQHDGLLTTFFGEETRLPDGAVKLAMQTSAPILPCFSVRLPNRHYQMNIQPSIEIEQAPTHDETVRLNHERLTRVVERGISEHPDQWVVFESIWGKDVTEPGDAASPAISPSPRPPSLNGEGANGR